MTDNRGTSLASGSRNSTRSGSSASETPSEREAVQVFKSFLESQRQRILNLHRSGAHGISVSSALCQMVDNVIKRAYEKMTQDILGYRHRDGSHGVHLAPCAVAALGGYGRGLLNPQSDVDILFIIRSHDQKTEKIVKGILYLLWDLRFDIGHSVRTPKECVHQAKRDITSKTAMLESRYLAGNTSLYREFQDAIVGQLNDRAFIKAKLAEKNQRHARTGLSVQLLEPNVKESPGGLRDIHTVQWLLKARKGSFFLESLLSSKLLPKRDYHLYVGALDFLLEVRNELHFLEGAKSDVLRYELQPQIAKALGYCDSPEGLAVEDFMRNYYLQARNTKHISDLLCNKLGGKNSKLRRFPKKDLADGTILSGGEIYLPKRRSSFFKEDPTRLLSIFFQAQRYRACISETAYRQIRIDLDLVDDDFRRSPQNRDMFLKILKAPYGVASTLFSMHELGVLESYIPEFGRINCLVQYDTYHVFTADEHTLVAIENIERIRGNGSPYTIARVLYEITGKIELLYLAILFHDIGKGEGKDHLKRGAQLSREVLSRWNFCDKERDTVEFLVANHLIMSQNSQRRDFNDPKFKETFAEKFPDLETLKMLYLLNYADLSALTKEALTDWKETLLTDLYYKTSERITSGAKEEEEKQKAEDALKKILTQLQDEFPEDKIRNHIRSLPPRYVLSNDAEHIRTHIKLVDSLDTQPIALSPQPESQFTSVHFAAKDRPYLLSQICAILAVNDINIFSAEIYTRADHTALDTFRVTDAKTHGPVRAGSWAEVEKQLQDIFGGHQSTELLFRQHERRWSKRKEPPKSARPTKVVFEAGVSDIYTVIDVFAQDTVGLLYKITRTLSDLGLDIHTAKITTEVDQTVDAFYITKVDGSRITYPDEQEIIADTLLDRIS